MRLDNHQTLTYKTNLKKRCLASLLDYTIFWSSVSYIYLIAQEFSYSRGGGKNFANLIRNNYLLALRLLNNYKILYIRNMAKEDRIKLIKDIENLRNSKVLTYIGVVTK